jgi:hypothetical protein
MKWRRLEEDIGNINQQSSPVKELSQNFYQTARPIALVFARSLNIRVKRAV